MTDNCHCFCLDLALWDFTTNDYESDLNHWPFARGFFDQIIGLNPHLSAIMPVFWFDGFDCPSDRKGDAVFRKSQAVLDYYALKQLFGSSGRLSSISLLSMSLGHFCASIHCTPNDFIAGYSSHPHPSGAMVFADLIIWQFIKPFEDIISTHCKRGGVLSREFEVIDSKVDVDSELNKLTGNEKDFFSHMYSEWKSYFSGLQHIVRYHVTHSLSLTTPLIVREPKITDFAINCAQSLSVPSGWPHEVNVNVFYNVTAETMNVKWVTADLFELLENDCAGWHHFGSRGWDRSDDQHRFTPTMAVECPSGAIEYLLCPFPKNWSRSQGRPSQLLLLDLIVHFVLLN